jgi:aminocarboxymuconate-semialdehyde decarboxylase
MRKSKVPLKKSKVARRDSKKLGAGEGAKALLDARSRGKSRKVSTSAVRKAAENISLAPWTMRPRGPVQPVSVDVHTHWMPERCAKALAEIGRPVRSKPEPLMVELAKTLKKMDKCGVRALLLGVSGRMPWYWLSPEEGARLAALFNDSAIEAHAAFPDRFFAGAELPACDPELALKELNRVAGKLGIVAVHLPSSMQAKDYLFQPAFEPIFTRCEQLGYPIMLHQLDEEVNYYGGARTRIGQPMTEGTFIYNTLGFPMDAATTATMFVITGTLDKHPDLEVVLPHAGGSFPVVAGRVEHGITRRKFKLQHPFRDYIRRFYYDSIIYYPETLRYMIDLVGVDRVMIGSDNSYARATLALDWPNALTESLNLPKEQEELILGGNAVRLFRL